jgi:hypothetical protein
MRCSPQLTSKVPALEHCHSLRFVDSVKCRAAIAPAGLKIKLQRLFELAGSTGNLFVAVGNICRTTLWALSCNIIVEHRRFLFWLNSCSDLGWNVFLPTAFETYLFKQCVLIGFCGRYFRPIADLGRHLGRCDVSSRKRSLTGVLIFHLQADLYAQLHEPHTAC